MSGIYLFIEAVDFTSSVKKCFGSDEAYAEFQSDLAIGPEKGPIIPDASPLQKIRWGDKRRGMVKRGGLRVIYVHNPDLKVLFMLDVYGKDEADVLTSAEKIELQPLAKKLIGDLGERNKRGKLWSETKREAHLPTD